ncbi:MAG: ABC transporter ATP-binding protein [Chloroflexi bacterium]|nr:ABC transporter ATP-binding protein [Chloroflexota bacterium]
MAITVRTLGKSYATSRGPIEALGPVDLDVHDGEFLCIVGPSGCGKTTLLRILAGLEQQTSGAFSITQTEPTRPANAMVFQGNWLFPWYNVTDNVQYGMRVRGVSRAERERTSLRLIEMVGLARFSEAYPYQLSEGMRQRVSLARALANEPEILLMDEPFGALDEQTRLLLQQELLKIWEQSRTTVIFVTHSIDEAIVLGDRVLVMSAAPGRILRDEPISFTRPRSVIGLKTDPRFGASVAHIWGALGDEVLKTKARETAG